LPLQRVERHAARRPNRLCSGGQVCRALAVALLLPDIAAATAPPENSTDQPIWRATHGLLLGLARAGNRIVAVGTRGNILLSDNEGESWKISKSGTDELLTGAVFTSGTEGWVIGQDERVLHSENAGDTWTEQHVAATSDQALFSIVAFSPKHLLASGAYNLILETNDGVTWREGKLPDLEDDYHLNCAAARGDDVLVTGEAGHAFIRYAGAWTAMKLPYDGSQFACATGKDGSFYSFGLRGRGFRAEPGAATWTPLQTGTQQSIFGASVLADGRMVLVGATGYVAVYDPANGNTITLPPQTGATLCAALPVAGGEIIVAGDDGLHRMRLPAATATAGNTP